MALRMGTWVRCEREAAPIGTWARYAGRIGRIVSVNKTDHEYGVRFTANNTETITWFLASELVEIDRPAKSPNIRTANERRE
jgi:hypothetical protein